MTRMAHHLLLALALCGFIAFAVPPASAQRDTSWVRINRESRELLAAGDTLGYRNDLLRLVDLLDGHPLMVRRLARAEAVMGHPETACRWLTRYASMGLTLDLDSDAQFSAALRDTGCRAARAALARNREPVGDTTAVFRLPRADLIAEDLTWDAARRRFLVSSVRQRSVLAFDATGKPLTMRGLAIDSLWSVMALRVDPVRKRLWVTTACLREAETWVAADSGRTAVLCYDLSNGHRLGRWEPARDGVNRVIGDMALAPDGTAYFTESVHGAVYSISPLLDSLRTLLPTATFASPQTPVVTPDGARLWVADYSLGIAVVDLATRAVTWMPHTPNVALTGIDGMYLVGRVLLAVQNGTQPERVVAFQMNEALDRIEAWRAIESATPGFGDPTHGVMVGTDFYYIANSGWDRVDSTKPGSPMEPGDPPRIMRIRIGDGR